MTASITLSGGVAPFAATLSPQIASVAVSGSTVVLTAQNRVGRATLHIVGADGGSVDVPVRVAFYAGTVPKTLALSVTGTVDPAWLSQIVADRVRNALAVQPGLTAAVGVPPVPAALPIGASASVEVPVRIAGGDAYLDVNDATNVTLQNVAVAPSSPDLLFYDDDPEMLGATGVTFRAQIDASHPARLYYYHENGQAPKDLYVLLSTAGGTATVHAVDSSAGPNIDVLSVGHAVTKNFLLRKPANEGVLYDVAQTPTVLERFALQRLEGAAGNVDLRVTSGGPVGVTVLSVPPGTPPAELERLAADAVLPNDTHHRTGTFALTGYANDVLEFRVGGPDVSLLYGAQSPAAAQPNPNWHDFGEYGVLRTLAFHVANPGGSPATVYLYEEPQGGVIRSSFLVDGTLHEVGCARVPQKYLIAAIPVTSATETHTVVTMTDGGSSYPVEVGLTMDPPSPTTPPIAAPDGCFPKPGAPAPSPQPTVPRI